MLNCCYSPCILLAVPEMKSVLTMRTHGSWMQDGSCYFAVCPRKLCRCAIRRNFLTVLEVLLKFAETSVFLVLCIFINSNIYHGSCITSTKRHYIVVDTWYYWFCLAQVHPLHCRALCSYHYRFRSRFPRGRARNERLIDERRKRNRDITRISCSSGFSF